jgi:Tetrahydrofolate dehydrogenase/cyclohydrolase, NAD(P)-binding domain
LHAVVIGRSPILGKPIGMLLLPRNATVTYCHSRTPDLPRIVAQADIVIAAAGRPELIKGAWIKPGAVVIDEGYNPGNTGDVEYARPPTEPGSSHQCPAASDRPRSPSCCTKPSQQHHNQPGCPLPRCVVSGDGTGVAEPVLVALWFGDNCPVPYLVTRP